MKSDDMKLETERLILRNFIKEDLTDFYEYAKDKNVGPRAGWKSYTNIKDAKKYIDKIIFKPLQLAIVLKKENKVIGCVELMECRREKYSIKENDNKKEIGAVLSSNYWNKGYMTEAIAAIIKYGFEVLNLEEIYACNASLNIGSARIQEKNNMKLYKIAENEETWINGIVCNKEIRRITKEEYEKRK